MSKLLATTKFQDAPIYSFDSNGFREFWDTYGLGRYNSGGAKVPRRGAGIVERRGKKAIEMRFAKYDPSFNQGANSNGLMVWQSEPVILAKELYVEFEHELGENFDFGGELKDGVLRYSGGKFGVGIQTIKTTTGGKPPLDQFTFVLMWRHGQDGQAEIFPYIYHSEMAGNYPDEIPTGHYIKVGEKNKFGLHWQASGTCAIYMNDKQIWEQSGFRFTDKEALNVLTAVSNFNGGSGKGWAHKVDCEAYLYSVSVYFGIPDKEPIEPPIDEDDDPPVIPSFDQINIDVDWKNVEPLRLKKFQQIEGLVANSPDDKIMIVHGEGATFFHDINSEIEDWTSSRCELRPEKLTRVTNEVFAWYEFYFTVNKIPRQIETQAIIFQLYDDTISAPIAQLQISHEGQFEDNQQGEIVLGIADDWARLGWRLERENRLRVMIDFDGYFSLRLNENEFQAEVKLDFGDGFTIPQFGIYANGQKNDAQKERQIKTGETVFQITHTRTKIIHAGSMRELFAKL